MAGKIALDLRQFKHVKSDNKSTTLMHKDGHQLTMAHSALSPDSVKQLQALGASAKDAKKPMDKDEAAQDSQMQLAKGGKVKSGTVHVNNTAKGIQQAQVLKENGAAPNGAVIVVHGDDEAPKKGVRGPDGEKPEVFADGGWVDKAVQVLKDSVKDEKPKPSPTPIKPPSETDPKGTKAISDYFGKEEYAQGGPVRKMYAEGENQVAPTDEAPQDNTPVYITDKNVNDPTAFSNTPDALKPSIPADDTSTGMFDIGAPITAPPKAESKASADTSVMPHWEPGEAKAEVAPPAIEKSSSRQPADAPPAKDATPGDNIFGDVAYTNQMKSAIGEQKAGAIGEQQAMNQMAKREAAIQQEAQGTSEKLYQEHQRAMETLLGEGAKIQDDVRNGHIDPQRFIKSMSTGGRILAGIGLVLSGIGSGLAHQPNLAYEYLNKQIDNDINAQKAELGKNENLLSYNMRALGNERLAYDVTKAHTNEMVSYKIKQAADEAQDPATKARMLGLAGQFDAQTAELTHKMASTIAINKALTGGSAVPPSIAERLPPEVRERVVQMPDGAMRVAFTKEGAKDVRDQLQTMQPILDGLDKLDTLGPKALIKGTNEYNKAQAIRAQMIPMVNENAGLKRLSAEDVENISHMFSDPTKFSQFIGGKERSNQFRSFLADKMKNNMSQQLEGGAPQSASPSGQHQVKAPRFDFKPRGK